MDRPKVLLAEDHEVVALGLRLLLQEDFQVFGPHADGSKIADIVEVLRPELLLLDLSLLNRNGMAIIPEVRLRAPDTSIIVVTAYDDYYLMEEALARGAKGYVTKSSGVESVLDAIKEVQAGGIYRQPDIHRPRRSAITSPHSAAIAELTPRRQMIILLVGEGLNNTAIAARLGISVATVFWHRTHIKRALGIRSEAELVRAAMVWFHAEFESLKRHSDKTLPRPGRRPRSS